LFTWLQYIEYGLTNFNINDGAYGSIFFMATGFHGIHIMIGTIFLLICYFRLAYIPSLKISQNLNLKTFSKALKLDMNSRSHLGFEFAAWYWHFVDIVWLALYLLLYIWSSI
jgi:heme/copper-type cytochrome/quinol oxidase subunit 3